MLRVASVLASGALAMAAVPATAQTGTLENCLDMLLMDGSIPAEVCDAMGQTPPKGPQVDNEGNDIEVRKNPPAPQR